VRGAERGSKGLRPGSECSAKVLLARSKGRASAWAMWENRGGIPGLCETSFPWRTNPSPYKVLLAELLLRKTRAEQAKRVYEELIGRFPDPCSLASVDVSELRELVERLGLKGRAEIIKAVADHVCRGHRGRVPCDRKELLRMRGIGPYAAGAILSFGCGQREPIVDSGIARLWERVMGERSSWRSAPYQDPVIWEASRSYIIHYPGPPDEGNYLLLDTARALCKPRRPRCFLCPIKGVCSFASFGGFGLGGESQHEPSCS